MKTQLYLSHIMFSSMCREEQRSLMKTNCFLNATELPETVLITSYARALVTFAYHWVSPLYPMEILEGCWRKIAWNFHNCSKNSQKLHSNCYWWNQTFDFWTDFHFSPWLWLSMERLNTNCKIADRLSSNDARKSSNSRRLSSSLTFSLI